VVYIQISRRISRRKIDFDIVTERSKTSCHPLNVTSAIQNGVAPSNGLGIARHIEFCGVNRDPAWLQARHLL
jgi:hypothetical protein